MKQVVKCRYIAKKKKKTDAIGLFGYLCGKVRGGPGMPASVSADRIIKETFFIIQSRTMKISKIEHLGIAVKSIEEALPYYEQVLGFECYNIETVEDQKVRTAFLKVGETKIELLEATSPESTIAKFIENRGEGIHHIAYTVEDGGAEALAECEQKEVRTIDKAPRAGAEGLKIAFLHPKSTKGVLTELCEE